MLIVGLIKFLDDSATGGSRAPLGYANQSGLTKSTRQDMQTASASHPLAPNLLVNPQLLTADPSAPGRPLHWESTSWGVNNAQFAFLHSGSSRDRRSVEVKITRYTSGSAEWLPTPVPVNDARQYSFSDVYRSNIASEVDASFYMPDGSITYQILGFAAPTTAWRPFTTTFAVPLGARSVSVYQYISGIGYLIADDYALAPHAPSGFRRPLVTLSFDDGYASTYTYGLPLLLRYHFTSTQFIITDAIGRHGYVTPGEIRRLYASRDEVGSHTVTHRNLTVESASQLKAEMRSSQLRLESIIRAPITDLAYPYGRYNASAMRAAQAVYISARGVEDGLNSKDQFDPFDLKVQDIYDTTTAADVAHWVALARATHTWLILVYHSVDPDLTSPIDGGIYNVTPGQLGAQLAALKSMGVAVVTIREAMRQISPRLR